MSKPRPKLQIVPYQPDNYSGGEVLALEDATIISSAQSVSAALSLYFEWEKKRFSQIVFKQGTHQKPIECTMSYDQDEVSPTEIRVKLHRHKKSLEVVPGSHAIMRFEIFRVSYEFSVAVTAVSGDSKQEGWHVILEVPSELKVLKSRKLPRLRLTKEAREDLPSAFWMLADGKKIELELLEIGMGTVRGRCQVARDEKIGKFILGEATVDAEIIRSADGEIVFSIKFEDSVMFGKYFDEYRKVAYPSLRSRYDFPYEVGIELYEKTGYFGTFKAEKSPEEKKEIMDTWENIKTGFHHTNADYYVTDGDLPVGCSGLALTNYSGVDPVWTFHQLCALKKPDLVEQSGVLYVWRAEYLAARPENLNAAVSFRSKSRWLERIYTKHASNSKLGTKLSAVLQYRCVLEKSVSSESLDLKSYFLGKARRISTISTRMWAAASPKYLNASANQDMIVAISEPTSLNELKKIGGQLADRLGESALSLVIVAPIDLDISSLKGVKGESDRYCCFPKGDLINLIASIEHSVAVTERKLKHVAIQ